MSLFSCLIMKMARETRQKYLWHNHLINKIWRIQMKHNYILGQCMRHHIKPIGIKGYNLICTRSKIIRIIRIIKIVGINLNKINGITPKIPFSNHPSSPWWSHQFLFILILTGTETCIAMKRHSHTLQFPFIIHCKIYRLYIQKSISPSLSRKVSQTLT